nr:protein STAY-GREEN, chloroplastic [Ipomoea batatas]
MGTLGASLLLPTKPIIAPEKKGSQFVFRERSSKNRLVVPVARLFGPSIFEASKLKVLKAFVHGDGNLLKNHPELQDSLVWVYFHSIIQEFNRVECWGPLKEAASPPPPPQPSIAADGGSSGGVGAHTEKTSLLSNWEIPQPCHDTCNCCFPSTTSIPWTASSYSSRGPFGPLGTNEPIQFGPQQQNFR